MGETCESNKCKQGKYESNGVSHDTQSAATVATQYLYNSTGSKQWLLRCLNEVIGHGWKGKAGDKSLGP